MNKKRMTMAMAMAKRSATKNTTRWPRPWWWAKRGNQKHKRTTKKVKWHTTPTSYNKNIYNATKEKRWQHTL
jgi:hypothetical protein